MNDALFAREDIFNTDVDIFLTQHWILVGVAADISEPGDVSTLDIGKSSISLVRDDDEQIQAFRNVCRHRGARLKPGGKSER